MFNVTKTAAQEILAAAARSGAQGMALRVAALEAGAEAFVSKRDLRVALHPILATLMRQKI